MTADQLNALREGAMALQDRARQCRNIIDLGTWEVPTGLAERACEFENMADTLLAMTELR